MRYATGASRAAWIAAVVVFACASLGTAAWAQSTVKTRQATINGLVVRELSNGRHVGFAAGIVATAKDHDGGAVSIRGTIHLSMVEALNEAARYVRVQHPKLADTHFEISFEERHAPKGGSSAATAFALLLRSMIEGFELDPKAAITGDISINGKVMPIGATVSKIAGAMEDGCTIVAVPVGNAPSVSDFFVATDVQANLAGVQIFSVETVDDAVAVMRTDRGEDLAQAIKVYAELEQIIAKYGTRALSKPTARQMIDRVLELAPNHLSAQYAKMFAERKPPKTLTRTASVIETFSAADDFWQALEGVNSRPPGQQYWTRDDLPHDSARQMKADLESLRGMTHEDVEDLRHAMHQWIDAIDRVLSSRRQISDSDWRIVDQRAKALREQLERLETDDELLEKMLREGY